MSTPSAAKSPRWTTGPNLGIGNEGSGERNEEVQASIARAVASRPGRSPPYQAATRTAEMNGRNGDDRPLSGTIPILRAQARATAAMATA